jgi:hypothetical protein
MHNNCDTLSNTVEYTHFDGVITQILKVSILIYLVCMFIFTLLLTISFSIVMINFVFIGLYHKIIGSLLCLYVTFRFVSLGLSSPGLAV